MTNLTETLWDALNKGDLKSVSKQISEVTAEVKADNDKAECQECKDIRDKYRGFGPRHEGSRSCESGSIASGGTKTHCTCDTCF